MHSLKSCPGVKREWGRERFFQFRDENRGRYYIVGEAEWIYGGGRGGNAS